MKLPPAALVKMGELKTTQYGLPTQEQAVKEQLQALLLN